MLLSCFHSHHLSRKGCIWLNELQAGRRAVGHQVDRVLGRIDGPALIGSLNLVCWIGVKQVRRGDLQARRLKKPIPRRTVHVLSYGGTFHQDGLQGPARTFDVRQSDGGRGRGWWQGRGFRVRVRRWSHFLISNDLIGWKIRWRQHLSEIRTLI